jgi:chemotaxis protein CheD
MSILDRSAKTPKPAAVAGFERVQRHWDPRIQRWSAKILPGEYYVTRHAEAVSTVLGSCVSACVRDVQLGVGGMNHFMLPEDTSVGTDVWSPVDGGLSGRYGAYAMESLINETLKLGAKRERLEIKLFGGGKILPTMTDVGARNIAFVRAFVALENFKVAAEDLGGTAPRHLIYFPATGQVLVKKLRPVETRSVAEHDVEYRARLACAPVDSDVELFNKP